MREELDGSGRCPWCGDDPLYVAYHDTEWGRPERDGRALWESLTLECFQAGLSWITILRRREGFRAAFAGFDPGVVAGWGEADILRLLADSGTSGTGARSRRRSRARRPMRGSRRARALPLSSGAMWGGSLCSPQGN
jgi:DNA-3-methyladenine glycosylase I